MFDPLPQREWAWFLPGAANSVPRQLAVEANPLFHPEVLRQQVRAYNLPERVVDWQPLAALGSSRALPPRNDVSCSIGRPG